MKCLLIPFLILLAGCGSGNNDRSKTTDNSMAKVDSAGGNKLRADTSMITSTGDHNAASANADGSVIFVGEFATWHHAGGDNFDGLYDSTQSLFSLCSTNKVEHVVSSEISYDQYASCDTTSSKGVMLLMKDSNGRLNPNGVSLNIVGDHAQVIGDPTRVIKLSPAVINRINALKVFKQPPASGKGPHKIIEPEKYLQKSQMITDSAKLMKMKVPKKPAVGVEKMSPALPNNHVIQNVETKKKIKE